MSRRLRAPQCLTRNAVMSILPTNVVTDLVSCQCSSLTSRKRVQRNRSLVRRAVITMVEMRMGKKHDINLGEVAISQRGRSQAFGSNRKTGQPDSNPRKKNWISEN